MSMTGYTKLFNSILASTIWQSSLETKVLWITLLAMADKEGIAEASIPGLAQMAGISIAQCEVSLQELLSPDRFSRTPDYEGRRIESVEGGWRILNHAKYRAKMGADERREYKRLKMREYRERDRGQDVDNTSTGGRSGHKVSASVVQPLDSDLGEDVDSLDEDLDREETSLLKALVALQASGEDVQVILDSLPRPAGMTPFNAHRALVGGRTGIPRTPKGLTVRQRLNDALEARQRAQAVPIISDSNRLTMEASLRVLERMNAGKKAKEVEG